MQDSNIYTRDDFIAAIEQIPSQTSRDSFYRILAETDAAIETYKATHPYVVYTSPFFLDMELDDEAAFAEYTEWMDQHVKGGYTHLEIGWTIVHFFESVIEATHYKLRWT